MVGILFTHNWVILYGFFTTPKLKFAGISVFYNSRQKFPEFYFIFLICVKIIPWRRKFVLVFLTLIRTFYHIFSDHTQFKHWWRQQFWRMSEYCFELRFVQKISHSFSVALSFFFFELISISLLLFWFLYNSIIIPVIMLKVKNAK